jgi:hypothetical protein
VAHAIEMRHEGPPFCKCPFPDAEGYATTEIGWPVPDDVDPGSPVEVATYRQRGHSSPRTSGRMKSSRARTG